MDTQTKRRRIAKLEYAMGSVGVWYRKTCYHRERVDDWDVRGHVVNHNVSKAFERAAQWAVDHGFNGSEIVNA